MMESLIEALLRQKQNSDEDFSVIKRRLHALPASEAKQIARRLKVKLVDANKKSELIARLLAMARLGTVRCTGAAPSNLCGDVVCDGGVPPSLSYMTEDVKEKLRALPAFDDVTELWTKDIGYSLEKFHFVHLHAYLVESRDKTFDAQSMRAFKSLKGYKYFADGFVRNIWMRIFENGVVYVRSFVFHSLTLDSALTVFIAMGTSGDVFNAQCNCVAGAGGACSHIATLLFAVEDKT